MHVYKINKIRKEYAYFLTKIYPFTDPATNPLIRIKLPSEIILTAKLKTY